MKIDRLIGIIAALQQKGKVTAPYLAEKFEVSRRTINRDIDDICRAGIPIVTLQGSDGGIKLMDGFSFDTTVFTEEELTAIFVGLKSLDSVTKKPKSAMLAEKIGGEKAARFSDSIMIDLSSFHKDCISEKIELLKEAIRLQKCVSFHYYYTYGDCGKLAEPMIIVFKWSDWYLMGYSPEREDFRLYKLSRMWDLTITEQGCLRREIPEEKLNLGGNITDDIMITAAYRPEVKYRLVEERGPSSFSETEDGGLYAEWGFSSYEKALEWFLSFGSKVKVVKPSDFCELYATEIKNIMKNIAESQT